MNEDFGADDPAADAFEAMRGEVALLRRAIEGLASERALTVPPDYSETLGLIMKMQRTLAIEMERMGQSPALAITPERLAGQLIAAATDVRREDHQTILKAGGDAAMAMSHMREIFGTVRRKNEQVRALWRVGIGAFILGALAGLGLAYVLGRALTHLLP